MGAFGRVGSTPLDLFDQIGETRLNGHMGLPRHKPVVIPLTKAVLRIDFDHAQGQDFNADGLLKPGLSVEPDVRVR